jgi:outer membrane autotransporter protein
MRNTKLAKVITLGMLLSTIGFGQAGAATITSGTYSIGGNIALTDTYVFSAENVTLNATSDVGFSSDGAENMALETDVNGTIVTVNMNGYNLATGIGGTYGKLLESRADSSQINVTNAYDINLYSQAKDNIIHGYADKSIVLVQANHDITMNGTENAKPAVASDNGATVTVNAGHDIIVKNASNPVLATNSSTTNLVAGNDISFTSLSNAGTMASVGSKLNLTATNGKIDILGTAGAVATLVSDSNSTTTVTAAKDITIGGNAVRGLRADSGTMSLTSQTGKINIKASNNTNTYSSSKGANAGIYAGTKSKYTARGNITLNSDTNVSAVLKGVHANKGDVTFNKAATITDAEKGVVAENTGTVTFNGDTSITSTTNEIAADNGTVTFAKGATLSGATTAISATNGGKVSATDTASAKKITGAVTSDGAGSSVDITLATADSYLTGSTDAVQYGALKLNLANGALWNVTDNSTLTDLVNNSTVNMRYTGNSTNEFIIADNLSGNGNYVMNTDLQASYDSKNVMQNGDKIAILTSSSGNNIIDLRDVSLDKKLASQGYLLLVADYSNGGATFTGKDLDHGGIFRYRPVITTTNPTDYTGFDASAKNWYLTGFEKLVEVSDNTKATLGLGETRYAGYLMDNDTLLKRLGELRTIKGEPEENGIWARYRHGSMSGDSFSGGSSMVQVGYDKKTSNKRYTGLAFNHTSNTYDFDGGATGEGSQDALTVYNTWLGDKNHYFDIVGKIGKMRGNSTYVDSLYPEKGNYDNWFASISGEYGRKNINDKNGWYYEPQVQLTLGRIRGADYTTSLGTKVELGSITSLIGRAGVTVGKEYNMKDANKHSNIYAKLNWLHEFKGDANIGLTDSYGDTYDTTKAYGGSWWNAGIGATINVNKNTHMYLDFEKNFGGEVTTNWIGQLGCQWTWK